MNAGSLSQRTIDAMDKSQRNELGLKSSSERDASVADIAEESIHKAVEEYCMFHGFVTLTKLPIERVKIMSAAPKNGWQFHLSKLGAKKNPTMPDITLFSNCGRFLWLELKKKGGKLRPLQKIMVDAGIWKVAYSSPEAVDIISSWMKSLKVGDGA